MKPINITKVNLDKKEIAQVVRVLKSGHLTQGEKVKEFEDRFAEYIGAKYAVAFNSGTAALHAACYAAEIKTGDEVVTSPFTFIASANCILMAGGKVVFADIEEESFCLNPKSVSDKITSKTKALLPIDLYGQPADYDELSKISAKHKIKIIEDSCQAVGAEFKGRKAGILGDIGCFSFYATKNLMTGEGGMLTTDNEDYAEKAKLLRSHGQKEGRRYEYYDLGFNYRMKDMEAVLGLEQLKKINRLNQKRIDNANYLNEGLSDVKGIILPKIGKDNKHVYHQYTVRITPQFKTDRNSLFSILQEKGINCGVYYPKPIHLSVHFKRSGYKQGDFPVAEKVAGEVISLPVHPGLTKKELNYIIKTIKSI